ncbi:Alpha/Beta hydrolase protein [Lipomyces arxii]|uniref:Alpha/Beta hydrolase protein n=1 Tax=Lipomyces arxii TaxID=56418 RepID=UPI0034CECE9F
MSDLQRNMIKTRISVPKIPEDESETPDQDELASLARFPPPLDSTPNLAGPKLRSRRPHYTALPWSDYWTESDTFTANDCAFKTYYSRPASGSPAWFIFHHGAGSGALSFSVLARQLRDALPHVGTFAFDARGHGDSTRSDDFSLTALSADAVALISHVVQLSAPVEPEIVLVGHSLGGAVATAAVHKIKELWPEGLTMPTISGLVVLDVVEGSALEGLGSMRSFIANRPTTFRSVEDSIRWHVKSHTVRNVDSARVSVPPIVQQQDAKFVWVTNLAATEPYWHDWFADLSNQFLTARTGKMLVLAGTDRLDRKLTIGQMQGKYQLEVLHDVGHFIQEDAPAKLAELLEQFWFRNRKGAALEIKALNAHSTSASLSAVLPKTSKQ